MQEIIFYSKHLKLAARELRTNMTVAEKILWNKLRRRQICNIQFLRQRPISMYIVDFYSKELHLAIEVDGEIHNTTSAKSNDNNRDQVLKSLGVHVIRFSNDQVINHIDYVIQSIVAKIKSNTI